MAASGEEVNFCESDKNDVGSKPRMAVIKGVPY